MKFYRLIVAYDGSNYFGWQIQTHKPSIAQALRDAFTSAFKVELKILGASRTDAGVHAWGQVVRVATMLNISADHLKWVWNNSLPLDITIRSLEEIGQGFNPFCGVIQKTYYYHFFTERPLPFLQKYGYFYPYKIDFEILRSALQIFVGTHDFASFRSSEDIRENTIRTIDFIDLVYLKRYGVYRIVVKGQKFMRHMIRRIVGASLTVSSMSGNNISLLETIFRACNPAHKLVNAPAKGLLLYKILYKSTPTKEELF